MKYFNRYNSFKEITKNLKNSEFKVLGTINHINAYPFFTIEINKQIKYPSLCLSAAIHGSEPSGVTGIISVTKNKERSVLVYFSIFVGILTILFVLLHSLFIND